MLITQRCNKPESVASSIGAEHTMLPVEDSSSESDAHVSMRNRKSQGCHMDNEKDLASCRSHETNLHELKSDMEGREDSEQLDMDSSSGSSISSVPENGRKGSSDSLDVFNDETVEDNRKPKQTSEVRRRNFSILKIMTMVTLMFLLFCLKFFTDGIQYLMNYRAYFGDKAPIPFTPMHGVAIGKSVKDDSVDGPSPRKQTKNNSSTELFAEYQFNSFVDSPEEIDMMHEAQHKAPLRMLIIGDSIARGVGVSNTCYPSFAETLSTTLSKRFGGRPVYWTAHGEPGATIKWIANKAEEHYVKRRILLEDGSSTSSLPSLKDFYDFSYVATATKDRIMHPPEIQKVWVDRLHYHQRLYETNPFGGYDIIIAISGINDIKRASVPFLCRDNIDDEYTASITDQDESSWRAKKRAKGFTGDLQRMIGNLIESSGFGTIDSKGFSPTCMADSASTCQFQDLGMTRKPHIFLPSFPASTVPAKMGKVLRMLGIKSTAVLDGMKRQEAERHSYDHVFVLSAPTVDDALAYLNGTSSKTSSIIGDKEINMQLVKVSPTKCKNLVDEMNHFYSNNVAPHEDYPTNSLYASDALHPGDSGYDFFARVLTDQIASKIEMQS